MARSTGWITKLIAALNIPVRDEGAASPAPGIAVHPEREEAEGPSQPSRVALLTDRVDEAEEGITEDTIAEGPADLLEHQAIAAALAAAIRDTDARAPLGIALYGPWGQGKSTIGRLLKHAFASEIRDGRVAFVKVDAWKYAHEGNPLPLRRHFLIGAYRAAGLEEEADEMAEGFRREKVRSEFTITREKLASKATAVVSWFRRSWWPVLATGGALVGIRLLVPFGTIAGPFRWILSGIITFGLALLTMAVPLLRNGLYVTTREDPSWSVDQFDDRLNALLLETRDDLDRFIFFIDDLDRCDDDLVVEAIETLQAFFGRSRCVYVVAADEEQLKRAVRVALQGPARALIAGSAVPADESFLEKIFQVAVDVPQLSPGAIERYAAEVAAETRLYELPESVREQVLSYLVHPRVRSPRQVRVIINQFVVAWAQTEEREASPNTYLQPGSLSSEKLLLAKLVVLRAHFPWFYELLFNDPTLLRRWQGREIGEPKVEELPNDEVELVEGAADRAARELTAFASQPRRDTHDEETQRVAQEESVSGRVLLDALRAYLSLTRSSLPSTDAHLQEFLYLRSRKEFAELLGSAGEAYQQAIATGDARAIERLVSTAPEQLLQAARVAIAIARDGNSVQKNAALNALVAMIQGMSGQDVTSIGEEAAALLYADEPDGQPSISASTEAAHARLVKWMPPRALSALAGVLSFDNPNAVDAFARRVAELSRFPDWKQFTERVLETRAENQLATAIRRMRPRAAVAVTGPTIEVMQDRLEASSERYDGPGVYLVSSDDRPQWLTFSEQPPGSSGEGTEIYVPSATTLDVETLSVGAQYNVAAHLDYEGDFVLERLATTDGDLLAEADERAVATTADREAAWTVLEALSHRVPGRDRAVLRPLARVDYQTAKDALRAATILLEAAHNPKLRGQRQLAEALDAGEAFSRFPQAEFVVLVAMLSLPAEILKDYAVQILKRSIAVGKEEIERGQLDELTDVLRRARAIFETEVVHKQIEALDIPTSADDLERLVRVLAAASPSMVAGKLGDALLSIRRNVIDAGDDDRAESEQQMEAIFDVFDRLAQAEPRLSRAAVRDLPRRADPQKYAERLLRLLAHAQALDLALPADFLRTAATASAQGASFARQHGLKRAELSKGQLEAVLAGIARWGLFQPPAVDEARAVVQRHSKRWPVLDQLAYVASLGGVHSASRLFAGEDLLGALFSEASNVLQDDPERARSLLDGCIGWRKEPRRVRKEAAVQFAKLIEDSRTEAQLELVLETTLHFFYDESRVEGVRSLRKALRKSLTRFAGLASPTLRTLLEQARDQLRVQPLGQAWFDDLIETAFSQ